MAENGEIISENNTYELAFDLPEHLESSRDLIITFALEDLAMRNVVITPESFDLESRIAASMMDEQLRGYWAWARIATDPESLPYQIRNSRYVKHPPEPFNAFSTPSKL